MEVALRRRLLVAAGCLAAALPYLFLAWRSWFVCDDAWIAARYSRRISEGLWWTFNVGEPAPVEGFSDLLWVLMGAAVEVGGGRSPEVLVYVSAICGLGVLALLYREAMAAGASEGAAIAAVAVVAAFPPFAVWATSGLETMAVVLALVGSLAVLTRGTSVRLAVLAVVLLALLRAEGPLWGLMVWVIARRRRGPDAVTEAAGMALVFAAVGLTGWRLWVFGTVLPHTAMVKVALGPVGMFRGFAWLALAGLVWLTPLLVVGALALRRDARWPAVVPWLQAAAGVLAFGVLVGGDYLPFHRFYAPAWALLGVPLAVALDRLDRGWALVGAVAGLVLLGGLPLARVQLVPESVLYPLQRAVGTREDGFRSDVISLKKERYRGPRRISWARAIGSVAEPGATIVARGVGALGYETELYVLDAYGLVSPEVAEQPAHPVAPGHDLRVQRGFFRGYLPDIVFAFALDHRNKGQVIDALPYQWGLFTDLGPDEVAYVAELVLLPPGEGPDELLLIRRHRSGEDLNELRETFKDAVRAAGYRAPRLPPLDERRVAVAREKRHGGANLQELLWATGHRPDQE